MLDNVCHHASAFLSLIQTLSGNTVHHCLWDFTTPCVFTANCPVYTSLPVKRYDMGISLLGKSLQTDCLFHARAIQKHSSPKNGNTLIIFQPFLLFQKWPHSHFYIFKVGTLRSTDITPAAIHHAVLSLNMRPCKWVTCLALRQLWVL